ncbi:MAG: hypothetical protein M3Z84_05070 [Actinomycetota bacterium]|nr:hypothetical protein [Actinomycetota bacterium]
MSRAIGELRDQLAATLDGALAQLAEEQRDFQKWLVDEQNHALGEALAPVQAEQEETLGQIRAENGSLREQITGILHEEMAKLAEEQKHWLIELVEKQRELLGEEVAIVAEEQNQFRKRLVAAARAAESKFADFGMRLNARLDQMAKQAAKQESDSETVASVLADTRRVADERFEQLGRALERPRDNQPLESMLGAIQKEIGLLRKALKSAPQKAQPTAKKAPGPTAATKARSVAKRTRPPPA